MRHAVASCALIENLLSDVAMVSRTKFLTGSPVSLYISPPMRATKMMVSSTIMEPWAMTDTHVLRRYLAGRA
jgi:hypothetical protein